MQRIRPLALSEARAVTLEPACAVTVSGFSGFHASRRSLAASGDGGRGTGHGGTGGRGGGGDGRTPFPRTTNHREPPSCSSCIHALLHSFRVDVDVSAMQRQRRRDNTRDGTRPVRPNICGQHLRPASLPPSRPLALHSTRAKTSLLCCSLSCLSLAPVDIVAYVSPRNGTGPWARLDVDPPATVVSSGLAAV